MVIETRIMKDDKNKCSSCHHDCHCDGDLHSDEYGVCTCEDCKCQQQKRVESTTKDSNEWLDGYNEWKKLTV